MMDARIPRVRCATLGFDVRQLRGRNVNIAMFNQSN